MYSAAREEILERVRFRGQAEISVIAGIFVFVGTYGAFIFGPAGTSKSLTMNDLTAYCGNLLFVTGLIWVGVVFVTRYAAHQNSKIIDPRGAKGAARNHSRHRPTAWSGVGVRSRDRLLEKTLNRPMHCSKSATPIMK